MANADLKAQYGDAWDEVAKARRALPPYNIERVMFEGGLGALLRLLHAGAHARALGRRRAPKPNGERLPEYTDARKPRSSGRWRRTRRSIPGLEKARLTASLAMMRDKLGADHALVKQILAGKTPEARAAELVAGTKLGDPAVRKALFAGGAAAVDASKDPFIELARLIEPRARELRKKYDNEVLAVERDAYAKIAQAVFATQGESAYPDGTFTLRLSYGAVKGYMENGKRVDAVHRRFAASTCAATSTA